uniref:Reverse transcriptase Ty1/copia-type domain-containing protein n=1 Tax=Tanacetum cinerariifolium TaxID=118510 RepID=A0A6L2LPF7_TANCI|nr:hypothetical protein [Tanacetum cinerariifolium]
MAEYSQKWHNGTSSKARSTETSDRLAAIKVQLNNLGREIKKVNEKLYDAQVGCKLCKGPHYTKDCPLKEEGKTLEEAYYIKFGAPYQPGGQYRAAGPGFYQRNNENSSRLQNYYCDDWREAQDVNILETYDHTLPQKEKDPGSFTLPCFIHNVYFDKSLVDLGASVSVMPFSTYTNLGLGILSHTSLTIELADKTIKQPRASKAYKPTGNSWNKADLEDQSLDDLFNNLKIYEAEVKSSSSTSHNTQNIAFVSSNNTDSTNELVSVVSNVSAASTKAPVSTLLNVDNLSNVVIYSFFASQSNSPQLDNEDLKQINADDLEAMDLKWHMAMLTMRAMRFLQRTGRNLGANGTGAIWFDMSKVEYYNCHRRGYFLRECRSHRDNRNKDTQRITVSVKTSTSNALVFDCDKMNSFESEDSMPTRPVHDRYKSGEGYHVVPPPYTGTFMPPKHDLVFNDASPTSETVPTVPSDSKDKSEHESMSKQKEPSFVPTNEHVKTPRASVKIVKHPRQAKTLRTDTQKSRGHKHSWNRKACFVCKSMNHLIKDYDFYAQQMVQKIPKPVKHVVNKAHLPIRRPINHRPVPKNSNFHQKVTTVKDKKVNAVKGTNGNWVWKPKCNVLNHVSRLTSASMTLQQIDYTYALRRSKHMTGNISYLSNFKETNGGYVAFGGNPKGGKITGKDTECVVLSSNFKLPDENHVLLRVLRENNMYNVDLKNVVPSRDLTCLFAKAALDEKWTKWLFDIDTLTQSMNYQPVVVGNQPNHNTGIQGNFNASKVIKKAVSAQQYVLLPIWSTGSTDPQNIDVAAAFDVKENENKVYVSPSSSEKTKKHDEKDKIETKGKSLVDLSTGVRDLKDDFEEFSVNSTNRVNAASAPVTTVGPNPTNSTNSFNAASTSDNHVSLNFKIGVKSSFVDPSQYPDDPDMPALEDIVYSDDEDDVGAEADFSNLETHISTRSMARMVKEQGFEDPDYPDKVYKVVKAFYGLHQAFIAWYETLANYLLENGFQRGKIDLTLSTKKELCKAFEKLMNDKFQMSSMGELTFFLGLQVKKKNDEIFINQDKYVAEILRKFGLIYGKSANTLIDTKKPLLKDHDGEDVDVHIYRYLKGKPNLGLWYPKDSPFNMVAYSDSNYVVASLDRKYIIGGCQFLGCRLFWGSVLVKKTNDVVKLQALINRKKVVITEDTIRQDLRLNDADGVECLPNEEIFAELARMGYEKPPPKLTFYKAFFSAQWNFLIHTLVQFLINNQVDDLSSYTTKYTSPALTQKVFANMRRIGKGFGEETPLFDTMLVQPQSDVVNEDDNEKVANLEQDKFAQALEIVKLKQRVKKLKKQRKLKHSGFKRLRKVGGRIKAIDADEDITLIDAETQSELVAELQRRLERKDEVNTAAKEVNAAKPTVFNNEEVTMTMAQTLIKMKAKKARILDEQMAKRLQDKEIEQAAAREKKEKEDFERAKDFLKLKEKTNLCSSSQEKHDCMFEEYGWLQDGTFKRVGGITQAYQSFEDMLKDFNREDLDALWRLVKERFSTTVPTVDKEKALWVELKRLFEPNVDEVIWKLQRYMHYLIIWKLYSNCRVHQVSLTTRRHDMYMLVEKDYPLSNEIMTVMLSTRLQVEEDSEMARDLVMKIFMKGNQPRSKSLDTSSN